MLVCIWNAGIYIELCFRNKIRFTYKFFWHDVHDERCWVSFRFVQTFIVHISTYVMESWRRQLSIRQTKLVSFTFPPLDYFRSLGTKTICDSSQCYLLCLSFMSSWLEDSVRLEVSWSGSDSLSSLSTSVFRFVLLLCPLEFWNFCWNHHNFKQARYRMKVLYNLRCCSKGCSFELKMWPEGERHILRSWRVRGTWNCEAWCSGGGCWARWAGRWRREIYLQKFL